MAPAHGGPFQPPCRSQWETGGIGMDYRPILLQLGITPNYKGFHQMLTALEIVEANPEALTMVTKWLYPAVAKRHHASWKQVERNLRTVTRVAWNTSNFMRDIALCPLGRRPTIAQFISIIWYTNII